MPRPRKPIEQKILDGSYRPGKHGDLTPEQEKFRAGLADGTSVVEPPQKPKGMPALASKKWDEVIATRPGGIFPSDGTLLEEFCCVWAEIQKIKKSIVNCETGSAMHKSLTVLRGINQDKLLAIGSRFGLTPVDRVRMPVVESGPKKARVETRGKTKLDLELEREVAKKSKSPKK